MTRADGPPPPASLAMPTAHPRSLRTPMTGLIPFAAIAVGGCAIDLFSKWVAVEGLGGTTVAVVPGRFSFMVVFNQGTTGGLTIGAYTWQVNVIVTIASLLLITMVAPSLAALDRRAIRALGLVAAGALGNLASMLAGPAGVADFLAVHTGPATMIVMNVADLLLWAGALMLVPVVGTIVRAIRVEQKQRAQRAANRARFAGTGAVV